MTVKMPVANFVGEAANIKNSGRWNNLNAKVIELRKSCHPSTAWRAELFGGLCFQVLSEYTQLKIAFDSDRPDPALLAWRARNLLELSIWSIHSSRNEGNSRRIYEDAGIDAMDLLIAFEIWNSNFVNSPDRITNFAEGKSQLVARAANAGIADLEGRYLRVVDAANDCGLKDVFVLMNKLLSKFAHPTAMQIIGVVDDKKRLLQISTFFEIGCCFFINGFVALENSKFAIE